MGLAQIHKQRRTFAGNPLGTVKIDLDNFHTHIANAMGKLVDKYYSDDYKIVSNLPIIIEKLKNISIPDNFTFILVDMDPTQFLSDGQLVTGLVDTEAYAIGPRELDFIALEYVLDQKSADYFAQGYKTILDIPDLSQCRVPYRYLYRLIEIQGQEDLDNWLNYPAFF